MENLTLPLLNDLIMWGTLALQVALVPLIFFAFVPARTPRWLQSSAMPIALLLVFFASLGSIYYSAIEGFAPCVLCWYQRILIFPQVLMLWYALLKRDRGVLPYVTLLSGTGILVALYHNFLPLFEDSYVCEPGEVSCLADYVTGFGYITIPVMSLTLFAVLLLLYRLERAKMV